MTTIIDRLSVLDASMLQLETPATPLQTGGIGIFEPGLEFGAVQSVLAARLTSLPRARQRVQAAPFGGSPVWVDDEQFDLTYHLRHVALPPPGDLAQLCGYLSRLIERPLDRNRPLWEMYVVAGLGGDRTALFWKTHLAMAGDDSGDPFSVVLDEKPTTPDTARLSQWKARPAPTAVELGRDTLKSLQAEGLSLVRDTTRVATDPSKLLDLAGGVIGSTAGLLVRVLRSTPDSPLNVTLSPHRRLAFASAELEDLRRIRRRFGGSINDIVVSVCADAVGRLLRWRGWDTGTLDLRVMVPVRIYGPGAPSESPSDDADMGARSAGQGSFGRGAVGVLAPFPVMAMDPVARLYRIMGELAGVKESRQAVAAENLVRLAGYAPPMLHAAAARVVSGADRYNLALSNAPGPQTPRFLGNVQLETTYPYVPLAGSAALSIAVSSYDGRLGFGLLGDRQAMSDIEQLSKFVTEAQEDLLAATD